MNISKAVFATSNSEKVCVDVNQTEQNSQERTGGDSESEELIGSDEFLNHEGYTWIVYRAIKSAPLQSSVFLPNRILSLPELPPEA
ncbi:hypothetical protein [Pedobacter glucosidilyticus]|uniref:hypothetical protein n=1 Tax=Pedobacter glucosidilyticus TaxID=1122941 RepID=UPI0004049391|nr:hypothetical protein [Pedobacter glucosidilyticus]